MINAYCARDPILGLGRGAFVCSSTNGSFRKRGQLFLADLQSRSGVNQNRLPAGYRHKCIHVLSRKRRENCLTDARQYARPGLHKCLAGV